MTAMSFGTWGGSGDMTATTNACVYRSDSQNYSVRARSSESSFNMTSGTFSLGYAVEYNSTSLTYNSLQTGFTNANTSAADCGGEKPQQIRVIVSATDLGNAMAGAYSGTLLLIVEP